MTTNVRFYRLGVLPSFEVDKHKGIFVHVTGTMHNKPWTPTNYPKEVNPATLLITTAVKEDEKIYLSTWLSKRRIDSIASGLWFGGENGWELLSNETNSGAINDAIEDKINALDVAGYAQATISDSTLTISGIQEVDGKIVKDDTKKLEVAIDGTYNESTNKIATESTVTNAITGLNAETVQAVTKTTSGNITTLTLKGVKEENGVIAQGNGTDTFIVGDAKLKIQIGSNEAGAFEVFSANKQSDSTIQLDGFVFKKNGDVISVITPTDVSERNRLVTEKDVANLAGAMHYKGSIASDTQWPANENVKAGDVYIVTTSFTHSGESNPFEVGDMIVFNSTSASDYKVVQSNLTLGTGDGQIAKNVGVLANGNLVVATENGIKTINITESDLTGTENGNNNRNLTYTNGTADTTGEITLYHDVTISDALKVIGKDFTKTIKISSTNRSIEIANNGNTGVVVDLVWNTSIE